jgi:hydrogenase maturation factor
MAHKGDSAIKEQVFFAERDDVIAQLAVAVASDDVEVMGPLVKSIAATVRGCGRLTRGGALLSKCGGS